MKKKICFVVAVPGSANSFLRDHIERLSKDYDVYLAGNIKSKKEVENLKIVDLKQIDIIRNISLFHDIRAIFQLTRYFKQMRFDSVHSVTPKAGLTTAIAGVLAHIPIRIHIFTGQVWATQKGIMRKLLKSIDHIIAELDTNILVDGQSQKRFLIENGIISEDKAKVLGLGSICGVNTSRFQPDSKVRTKARHELNLSDDKLVFVFMGRLTRDKGIFELLSAFDKLAATNPNVYLLLFGNDEGNIGNIFKKYSHIKANENFTYYGRTNKPYQMLQAGDVFVLPTYREGFGSSVIEASCLGLPVITSDVYGVLDAAVDGVTGLRCKVGDENSLYEAMQTLANDKVLRKEFGKNGRIRVLESFTSDIVTTAWAEYYHSLIPVVSERKHVQGNFNQNR